jgi:hypothetical protein
VTPYATRPRRALAQLLGDVLAVGWAYLWVRLAFGVHDAMLALAAPARLLEDAGTALERNLHAAGGTAERVPLVGDELRRPLDSAAGAGATLAQSGRDQQEAVADIAVTLGVVTAAVPLLVTLWWLLHRLRWMRQATAARRTAAEDESLLALRALATQPLTRLRAIAPDPLAAWRDGDPEVVSTLARLELRRLGLRGQRPGRALQGASAGRSPAKPS